MMRVEMTIDPAIVKIADTVSRNLQNKILPKALDAAAKMVIPALIAELPDGRQDDGRGYGTRELQSRKSKERFPTHMKEQVGVKRFRAKRGAVLRIVGVKARSATGVGAGHVNFDHGEKAKSIGRTHILWGKGPAKVNPRVQKKDIARVVQVKVAPAVEAVVKQHIDHAVSTGELLR